MNIGTLTVGFLGAGRMATALAQGFCRELLTPSQIIALDPVEAARREFVEAIGSEVVALQSPADALGAADILFLAVKPQVLPAAIATITDQIRSTQLVVSIAAGIRLSQLQSLLPDLIRVVRVMPNTPCLVGEGACGISGGQHASEKDVTIVTRLLESVGIVECVDESLMDAITGLSGSGPAYGFQMIEALSDGGVNMGLSRPSATRLAAQTLLGAAKMVLETNEHPGVLKDAVTSPGGTTIAALQVLERCGLRAALMNAVSAATERSRKLGQT